MFKELEIDDIFNTMSGRWRKISETQAVVTMSAVHKVGEIYDFKPDSEVIKMPKDREFK